MRKLVCKVGLRMDLERLIDGLVGRVLDINNNGMVL